MAHWRKREPARPRRGGEAVATVAPFGASAPEGMAPSTSLRSRLALSGAAIIVVLILLLLAVNWVLFDRSVRSSMENSGRLLASLLAYEVARPLEAESHEGVQDGLSGVFQSDAAVFVSVHGRDGRPIAVLGDPPPSDLESAVPTAVESRWEAGLLRVRVPVRDARLQPIGVLQIGLLSGRLNPAVRSTPIVFLAMGVVFVLLALGAGQMQARNLAAPLLELAAATRAVRQGSEPITLAVRRTDEIGLVLRSFNEMAEHLRASRGELERRKGELEETVRRRTEELEAKNRALAAQNERVLEASRLKSDFVASISHELRTPLNAILALSDLLRDEVTGPLANDEQRHQIGLIRQAGENLLRLISDILDLSRIEAGRVEIRPQEVELRDVLRAVAEEMRPLAAERGLELKVSMPPEGRLWFDPDRVGQILRNLVANAIKFTERGHVRFEGRVDAERERIVLTVEDTGIGIAPQDQEAIFQEFRQVDGSVTRKHGGTGLGLAISRRLVLLMGGEISVRSDLGRGSVFTFWVPARRERPTVPVEAEAPPPAPPNLLELPGSWDEEPGELRAA